MQFVFRNAASQLSLEVRSWFWSALISFGGIAKFNHNRRMEIKENSPVICRITHKPQHNARDVMPATRAAARTLWSDLVTKGGKKADLLFLSLLIE